MRDTAIHAPAERRKPPEARPKLVEATVSLMGRTYRTTVPEGTSAEGLIEQVAKENGGYVTKKFYPEFNTSEIIAVKIGNELMVKSSESGIHFSLGDAGIPIALVDGQAGPGTGIVFPNAEELRVGLCTRNIALWTTSANFDPGSISDLDTQYGPKGGVRLSRSALDEVSKAHGGVRSEKLMLEDNILVLNKDSGEVLTASEHASRMQDAPFAPGAAMPAALPSYSSAQSAIPAAPSQSAPAFDGIPGRLDRLIIRTFDGMLADAVRIRFNPISALNPPMGQNDALHGEAGQTGILERPLSASRRFSPPRLAFTLLSFNSPSASPAGEPREAGAAQAPMEKLPVHAGHSAAGQRLPPPRPFKATEPAPSIPKAIHAAPRMPEAPCHAAAAQRLPEPREALKAWSEPRSAPVSLPVPARAMPLPAIRESFDAVSAPAGPEEFPAPAVAAPKSKKRRRRTLPARMPAAGARRAYPEKRRPAPKAGSRPKAKKHAARMAKEKKRGPLRPTAHNAAGAARKRKGKRTPKPESRKWQRRRALPAKPAASRRNTFKRRKMAPDALRSRGRPKPKAKLHKPHAPPLHPAAASRRKKSPHRPISPARNTPVRSAGRTRRRAKRGRHIVKLLLGVFSREKGKKKITGRSAAGNSG